MKHSYNFKRNRLAPPHPTLTWEDCSVLHCASLLRTILASLVRTHERLQVHNERDFSKARLDSEVNARFLSNEVGDLYFLLHKFGVRSIFFKLKNLKKTCVEGKKM